MNVGRFVMLKIEATSTTFVLFANEPVIKVCVQFSDKQCIAMFQINPVIFSYVLLLLDPTDLVNDEHSHNFIMTNMLIMMITMI